MLRVATVLTSARMSSRNPTRAARSHIALPAHSVAGSGLTIGPQPGRLEISMAQMMQRRTAI